MTETHSLRCTWCTKWCFVLCCLQSSSVQGKNQ